ncbi:MAG: cytochrome C oxidase subunit I [Halothiobacillus sp. 20-53-49]|nr:cbb3-type cytochrome c oxidase subunit I [Halothiobacillaceae bacterium]OYV46432.1 MAG: cytochrome C oxidase subunit I [Halothiobacillus sp. 20-53-49]
MSITAEEAGRLSQTQSTTASALRLGNRLGMSNLWFAFVALLLGLPMGLYQVAERSGYFPWLESSHVYFASTSTHGVLMAYVLTTFFMMGYGYHSMAHSLKIKTWSPLFSWAGFYLAVFGTALAAVMLLTGKASVMYTFYPPEMADPLFYIGAVLLVVGSWFWCIDMIAGMTQWKKQNPSKPVPLVMFGTTINALLWMWTSAGVAIEALFQLIPVSLGLKETLDPGMARTLFSWTLHAIVYVWLIPAYIAMYTLVPKLAGGKLFSDEFARIAFVMLFIFSVPIGFHHLYMDPQQAAGWKLLHMLGTFMVAVPTFLTGFTVLASLEIASRLRGGKGIFGWMLGLDWKEPMVVAGMLAMFMLTFGGFGGLINASYSMNAMIHNTQWVTGHFHLIFGGTTVIMYLAVAYWIWPKITGRQLHSKAMAVWQLWLWFIGMLVLTLPWHYIGLLWYPRRVSSTPYEHVGVVAQWGIYELMMVVGGIILVVSGVMFIYNLIRTHTNKIAEPDMTVSYAEAIHPPLKVPNILNSLSFWNWAMAAYMLISYGYPLLQFFFIGTHGAVPFGI